MASAKLLANMYKKMLQDPVEGFVVELEDESNLYEWKIWVEGPKDSPYNGGIFLLQMKFPPDFPMSPPELKFVSEFWHPNVYAETGAVCISILHPPGEDEMSGERADERWLPTQSVTSVLLSVISLLNAPNTSSPANVDASVEWRKDPEGFRRRCVRLIEKANESLPSHVVIPHPDTNPEERAKVIQKIKLQTEPVNIEEFEHDDMIYDSEEDDDASESSSEPKPKETKTTSEIKRTTQPTKQETESTTKQSKKSNNGKKKKKCSIM